MKVAHVRKFILVIFFVWFIILMSKSIQNLSSPRLGITHYSRKSGEFPSITVCPHSYVNGEDLLKFEDYQNLPSILDFTSIKGTTIEDGDV